MPWNTKVKVEINFNLCLLCISLSFKYLFWTNWFQSMFYADIGLHMSNIYDRTVIRYKYEGGREGGREGERDRERQTEVCVCVCGVGGGWHGCLICTVLCIRNLNIHQLPFVSPQPTQSLVCTSSAFALRSSTRSRMLWMPTRSWSAWTAISGMMSTQHV